VFLGLIAWLTVLSALLIVCIDRGSKYLALWMLWICNIKSSCTSDIFSLDWLLAGLYTSNTACLDEVETKFKHYKPPCLSFLSAVLQLIFSI